MKYNRIVAFFSMLLTLIFWSYAAKAEDPAGPVDMLQSIANQMISDLHAHQATLHANRQYVYSLAYRLVVPHVDVNEMSRRVLPPQTWERATASQRSAFEHQFMELMVHTYASALASYTDQTVKFYPVRGSYAEKHTIEVNSVITSASGAPPVNVRYRLIREDGGWKLYDMSVEGVSVIESFRSQFADVLATGDINALTKRLAEHNASVPAND